MFRSRAVLQLENLALRHQIGVLQRSARKRPQLTPADRLLWVWLSCLWLDWRSALAIVKPETVVAWHRAGFRRFWTWKVRHGRPGRPVVSREVRNLIRRMCRENPSWVAPRVHGKLLKLGIDIGETSVSKYMVRCHQPPSQTWRTFLENHAQQLVSIDFFTVPTLRFQVLYVFLVLAREPAAPSPLQCDGSSDGGMDGAATFDQLPRECLDHVLVFDESSLRRILRLYLGYDHRSRTHLSLSKDSPEPRSIQPEHMGRVVALPQVGGLHHRYERRAA